VGAAFLLHVTVKNAFDDLSFVYAVSMAVESKGKVGTAVVVGFDIKWRRLSELFGVVFQDYLA